MRDGFLLIALIAGGLLAALGLAVMAGWYFQIGALVQVRPDLPPVRFNLALSFTMLGLSFPMRDLRHLPRWSAWGVLAIDD